MDNRDSLSDIRLKMRSAQRAPEPDMLDRLTGENAPSDDVRAAIVARAGSLVSQIRKENRPGLMEVFLAEYGLSTEEGVALMCLAEALLRVPDAETIDDLIEDKIAPSKWGQHLGHSSSSLVNASTWALMLTGKVLDTDESKGMAGLLHGAVKRLGEPVIRTAVRRSMKELGSQFVLGETIQSAMQRAANMEAKGYSYSYDMLGEAALTAKDATHYFEAYRKAIKAIAERCTSDDIRRNPGISVKFSALHPRYEVTKRERVMRELVPRVVELAALAAKSGMGFNIDAEEADRLDISLDVIEAVLSDERLAGWDGFGVVVQAYGKRASHVLDWLHELAVRLDRRIMVRLVKGAYWDTEIKRAQVDGVPDFPVYTHKAATDVAYVCCARKLLGMTDRIYPQFATHNAHTVAAILEMADDKNTFEFQRLHGMGEALHRLVLTGEGTRCRIYAPVGAHRDLLAYLVRRLLENGANSSFVNQIVDDAVPVAEIVADPFEKIGKAGGPPVRKPADIFQPVRSNSKGFDLRNLDDVDTIEAAREPFRSTVFAAAPLLAVAHGGKASYEARNPANPDDIVGTVTDATAEDVAAALDAASDWADSTPEARAAALRRTAELCEEHFGEIFAILAREAGKTPIDAVGEVREAVDFLRYYASQIDTLGDGKPRGLFACISPWNFPLAIFTGQIAAALAAGNGVLAKPAEQTPLIAHRAVQLMHEAGVPRAVLQLLPGDGATVGAALTSDPRIGGVCFTGSTETAQAINRAMADNMAPDAPLIAETGGLNAMIVDSTALPEQAVKDIVASAFQSAGQRCSALRVLYVQEDVAPAFLDMLYGAMDELQVGEPWHYSTDSGPVIDAEALETITSHVEKARIEKRLLKQVEIPSQGTFAPPTALKVTGIGDLEREIFGPVLHVATFKASRIDKVIADINGTGYGLTFGLHSRIDDRVEHVTSRVEAGNLYINRNQIGAVVGSQPFGGEGLSGTGPKAGGPHYLARFTQTARETASNEGGPAADRISVQARLDQLKKPARLPLSTHQMPGVTGESNRLSSYARGRVLCLGPTAKQAHQQVEIAAAHGCAALSVAPGASGAANGVPFHLDRALLADLTGFDAVMLWGEEDDLRAARQALAKRRGPIIPLITGRDPGSMLVLERHVCIDTTAAGGNAQLLAANA